MRRRWIALVLAMVIAGSSGTVAATQPHSLSMSTLAVSAAKANYSKITTANLNLRKSSNTTSATLLVIQKNATLAVTETNGKWNKVSFKGKTGWVSGAYLKNAPVQKPAPNVVHNYATTYTALFESASENR